jgi:putative membrane protein
MLAHGTQSAALGPADAILLAIVIAAWLGYRRGTLRLRRPGGNPHLPPWRAGCFGAGLVVLLLAVSAPAEHLADELFVAHMAQHLLLAFVAAPLLVLGRPVLVTAVLLGHRAARGTRPLRRAAVRIRRSPAALAALAAVHVVPWYVWHAPAAYELALRSEGVHVLEHVSLLASGAALAWLVLGRAPALSALATVVAGMLTMGVLAAVLALGGTLLFDGHAPGSWGLSPLVDQQLGGALMWFPGSLAYLTAAGALVLGRLARPGGQPRRQEARSVAPAP